MNTTANLGKAPVRTLVLQLAIPSMTAQFVNVLYSIIDRMYIGHISENGALALAGAGMRSYRYTSHFFWHPGRNRRFHYHGNPNGRKESQKSRTGTGKFFSDAQYFFCSADCQLSSTKR